MLHHQKAQDGNGKLARGLARHFAVPDGDFDRWHYLTQVNQARAVATGIEHWRSRWPVCAGTIVWQLNDCWPVTSWAAIDGDGREKPLYHELRRLYADRLLTLQPRGEGLVLAAVNQSGQPWSGTLSLRRVSVEGEVIGAASVELAVGARLVGEVRVPPELEPAGAKEFLVADAWGQPDRPGVGCGRCTSRCRTVRSRIRSRGSRWPWHRGASRSRPAPSSGICCSRPTGWIRGRGPTGGS